MAFQVQALGMAQANAYVIYDPARADAFVLDPGGEPEAIRLLLGERQLSGIVLTHGHFDHIGAVSALRGEGVPVYIHEADAPMLDNPNLSLAVMGGGVQTHGAPDFCLTEGESEIAGVAFEVLHTPGHTPGSICLKIGDDLFSGDTLFCAGVGRTDFPGGSAATLRQSLKRLLALPPETRVHPGHGEGTTIGAERRYFGG
jgi:glyoxylase-like metal-dependent hydrolase (beta-lactamase superfamily II)